MWSQFNLFSFPCEIVLLTGAFYWFLFPRMIEELSQWILEKERGHNSLGPAWEVVGQMVEGWYQTASMWAHLSSSFGLLRNYFYLFKILFFSAIAIDIVAWFWYCISLPYILQTMPFSVKILNSSPGIYLQSND